MKNIADHKLYFFYSSEYEKMINLFLFYFFLFFENRLFKSMSDTIVTFWN